MQGLRGEVSVLCDVRVVRGVVYETVELWRPIKVDAAERVLEWLSFVKAITSGK